MSFDHLDDALLIEILQRLPDVKFTSKMKLVCTNWNRVLSTPCFVQSFIDYHQTRSKELKLSGLIFLRLDKNMLSGQDPILETTWDTEDPIFWTSKLDVTLPSNLVKPEDLITSFRVVASCKELLLCESFNGGGIMYYICNPLTRSWVALPPCPSKYDDYYNVLAGLVCCRRYCQVVRIVRSVSRNKALTGLIFCFETKKWKESSLLHPKNKSFQSGFSGLNSFPLSTNGALHWLTEDSKTVVAYKPQSPEELHFIDVPEEVDGDEEAPMVSRLNLGVCKSGSLQLCKFWFFPTTYSSGYEHTLRVWELEDYGTGEWRWLKHKAYYTEDMTRDDDWFRIYYMRESRTRTSLLSNLFQLVLPPWWPTAVPTLSAHNIP